MGPSLQCKQLSHWLLVIQQISWCSECLWPVWPWSIWILAESYGMRHQENYTSYLQGFRVKAWMLLQITSLLLRNSSWISVGQRLMFCLDGQSLEKNKIWRLMRSFGEEVFGWTFQNKPKNQGICVPCDCSPKSTQCRGCFQ